MSYLFAQSKEEKELYVKQVQNIDRKMESFIKKGMIDSVAGLFSPNCHMAGEYGTIVEDREKVQEIFNTDKKAGKKYTEYTLNAFEHKVYDDIVLEIGTNTVRYSIGMDKRLYTTEYNYMLVWKRSKEGKYQIRAAMWNLTKNPCAQ